MARCLYMFVIKCICFFTCFYCVKCRINKHAPSITSISILSKTVNNLSGDTGVNYFTKVEGVNLNPRMIIRPTTVSGAKGKHCVFHNNDLNEYCKAYTEPYFVNETIGFLSLTVTNLEIDEPLYFCVGTEDAALKPSISAYRGELIKWIHQGQNVFLQIDNSQTSAIRGTYYFNSSCANVNETRNRRDVFPAEIGDRKIPNPNVQRDTTMPGLVKAKRAAEDEQIVIHGLRVESSDYDPTFGDDGIVQLLAHTTARVRLFGVGLSSNVLVAFTMTEAEGGVCEFPSAEVFRVLEGTVTNHSAVVEVRVPGLINSNQPYYLCIKESLQPNETNALNKLWRHQGSEKWLQFRVYEKLLPVWVTIIIIILLLFFSALFSGLTLGLMSMDKTDLRILCTTGTELERKYASAIMPVRSHGSLLLCSLLLGNVLVNSVLTILMDDLTSGLIAVIFSTLAIVIFGEIMPQAICSRHGLAVGAKTIYITKFVILLTFLVAYPISKILDFMLGEEIGNVYNRERLKELVKTGTDIEKDEVNIISGALELSKKTVADVMTKLEDAYMLDYDSILNFETVSEIMKSGYSRIPVFEGSRSNIVSLLLIKDLAFIDPDDNTPLKTLCEFYQNSCYFVFEDMTLDVLFRQFKEGNRGHMAFVTRVNAEGEGDPFYETIGLVTLEDVIEELIQAEIVDETDVWTDNKSKRKREKKWNTDFSTFCEKNENQRIHISPQLTLATFQYLSTTVEAFKPNVISERILRRLIKQDVIYHIKIKNKDRGKSDQLTLIYQQGKPVDYFVLILEGRVEVVVGKEEMKFESGPFTYFGSQALTQNIGVGGDSPTAAIPSSNTGSLQSVNIDTIIRHTFIPDYTVRAITEVFYIKIKRSLYLAAKRATLLEQSQKTDDHFDDEVDKLLHSLDEDDRSQGQRSQDSPVMNRNQNQSDKESLQRSSSAAAESPRSHQPPSNPSSPQEPNGSVRTPLSPVKSRTDENNAIIKLMQDKVVIGDSFDKTASSENPSLDFEERTNLLRQSDEIS